MSVDEDLLKRVSEMVGGIKVADAVGKFAGAIHYTLLRQVRDSKIYKKLGKDWETFCREDLGRDRKTVETEMKFQEEFGEYFMKSVERIRITKRDMLALHKELPESTKAEIRKGVITINDREFDLRQYEEDVDEIQEAFDWLKQKAGLVEKIERAHEKELKRHEKAEAKHVVEVEALKKELSALKPPETDEDGKKRFNEQLDLVYKYLGDAGHLMNHVMDFSLVSSDRELIVKYRGAVKALRTLADNLEYKTEEM